MLCEAIPGTKWKLCRLTSGLPKILKAWYGVGPRGSPRLRKALASFFNSEFRSHDPVRDTDVLILPGVISVLDARSWSICNENEGTIVLVPYYTGFKPASLDDVFSPKMNQQALESALRKAESDGGKVRAVLISKYETILPHNPLGRCYPAETLGEIARFCGSNNLHLISDEIFVRLVYGSLRASYAMLFTSVVLLDLSDCIARHLVHVAYGVGKDFCASGLRIGVLLSRNDGSVSALTMCSVFKWVPYLTQNAWAKMLDDDQFLAAFNAKNANILGGHNASPLSNLESYRHRETELFKRCLERGVGISPGSSFCTEELGWLRICFAVEKQALYVGSQRLLECLKAIETSN
ncbi:putative acc synthase [Xylaria arbuscula]|nr:putative acc synthase [Xylaria arbuscula]